MIELIQGLACKLTGRGFVYRCEFSYATTRHGPRIFWFRRSVRVKLPSAIDKSRLVKAACVDPKEIARVIKENGIPGNGYVEFEPVCYLGFF